MRSARDRIRALRSLFGAGACAAGVLLAAGGCTGGPGTTEAGPPTPPTPVRGGELHVMLESPGTLDPPRVDDIYESCITNQLFDGLLELDTDLHPVPCIAKEWTVSRDGRVYEFSLRDDVFFHNGRRVVAEDFVYSLSRIVDPARADHGIAGEFIHKIEGVDEFARGEAPAIRGLQAAGDDRLTITLKNPYASFLSILAMDQTKVVPREEVERRGEEFGNHPVGTGPFRMTESLTERDAENLLVAEANESYFRGRPHLDRVVFHTTTDYNSDRSARALQDGVVSLTIVPADQLGAISVDRRFRIIRRTELSFAFLGLNHAMPPFDDPRVRRAFAHAIDRQGVANADPTGRVVAAGILPPGMFGYSPESKGLEYDPEAAARLLAEAGHPNGAGLPKIVYWQSNRGEAGKRADAALAKDFERAGFPVEFRYVSWDEFDVKLMRHEMQSFGLSWIADLPDPDSILASLFASGGSFNFFRYENPAVDSLLAVGTGLRASNDRAHIYRDAERRIIQDVAMIPLYHVTSLYAVRRDLEGLVVTPFGLASLQLESVWFDPPQPRAGAVAAAQPDSASSAREGSAL